jgi:hypothetical protein
MNGTQYAQKRFTLPASQGTSEMQWDYAFLSATEFIKKYGQEKYDSFKK